MASIFPNNGVVATAATNTVDVPTTCEELFYDTGNCRPRFNPAAANAVMSELLNLSNCLGHTWDCNVLNNLCEAIGPATIASIQCEMPDTATQLVSAYWVSEFINQGHQFRSGDIIDETTDCNRSVVAGENITVRGDNSIGSGVDNFVSGENTFVNGDANTVTGDNNIVTGDTNTVGGARNLTTGFQNTGNSDDSIVGGRNNVVATGESANLVSGRTHNVTGSFAVVSGDENAVGGNSGSTVGTLNTNNGLYADISGDNNRVANGTQSNSVSGSFNVVEAGDYNTVSGRNNTILGGNSSIIGGNTNTVNGDTGLIVVGGDNTVTGQPTNAAIFGQSITLTGNAGNSLVSGDEHLMGSQNGTILGGRGNSTGNAAINRHIIGGRFVVNPNDNTTAWGDNAGGPALSSNRTVEIVHATGNVRSAGAFTAGFAFPGFGEYYINPLDLGVGYLVTSDDGITIRLAEAGDDIDGITRKEIAMSPGGGIDPTNSPYALDKMGNRVIGDNDKPILNPLYDESKTVAKMGVEMLGRTFVRVDGEVTAGQYLTAGKGGIATASKDKTGIRVHSYEDGIAFVTIK